jgi:hypothetical protein
MESPQVIQYASAPTAATRITFRGAVATLCTGAFFLLLSVGLIYIAWNIFDAYNRAQSYRAGSMEALGVFVTVLAGLSFIAGVIITIMGLRGVRQRELV